MFLVPLAAEPSLWLLNQIEVEVEWMSATNYSTIVPNNVQIIYSENKLFSNEKQIWIILSQFLTLFFCPSSDRKVVTASLFSVLSNPLLSAVWRSLNDLLEKSTGGTKMAPNIWQKGQNKK